MSDQSNRSPEEIPSDRFRRLLSESGESENRMPESSEAASSGPAEVFPAAGPSEGDGADHEPSAQEPDLQPGDGALQAGAAAFPAPEAGEPQVSEVDSQSESQPAGLQGEEPAVQADASAVGETPAESAAAVSSAPEGGEASDTAVSQDIAAGGETAGPADEQGQAAVFAAPDEPESVIDSAPEPADDSSGQPAGEAAVFPAPDQAQIPQADQGGAAVFETPEVPQLSADEEPAAAEPAPGEPETASTPEIPPVSVFLAPPEPEPGPDQDDTRPLYLRETLAVTTDDSPGESPDQEPGSSLDETRPVATSGDTAPTRVGTDPSHLAETRPLPVSGEERPGELYEGHTPPRGTPLNAQGTPLPRRVHERDIDATRVTPAAYSSGTRPASLPPIRRPPPTIPGPSAARAQAGQAAGAPPRYPPPPARRAAQPRDFSRSLGCLLRFALLSIFGLVLVALCGVSILLYQYYSIARTLPDIDDLRNRASQFETTRILDRNGDLLYEIFDPNAGRRTYVPLENISPYLVAATIATEDKEFYNHPGVDLIAILRAAWQNYSAGETVSGASTITQQLARNLLFSPEERYEQTYERKVREAILATEITRRYSKDEILELYLNENYYGNLAYGVEAAAETYFGTTADKLTLGQAAFLAGLQQAPSVYDIYTNRELTLRRMEDVLVLMFEASQEQGCIYVSNSPQPVCLDPVAVTQAAQEIRNYEFKPPVVEMNYPHWVTYVRALLESQFDAETIYRSGFTVYTTLDPALQDLAEQIVAEQVAALADRNATDGALVAIKPNTGEILAMVGSADFYNEAISGQVNMAISPRQPGSAIKPLTYLAAFEKGWTPATLIWDVPSEFPPSGRADDTRPPYEPVNYDGRFHGPVTVRSALANSYNIPAVKTLAFVGLYDDPSTPQEDGFLELARRMGITTLNRDDYGLSLTLGGGDVSLLELTGAYATLANYGRRVPPVAITRILDHNGNVVYDYQQPAGEQVVRAEHAYLITSILSDNQARTPAFGSDSVLNLPFAAAVKTGTTNDFRDNLTVGYTPDLAVGVWVGNADYTPMQNTSGLTGAAPIWSQFMQQAAPAVAGGTPSPFTRPAGIVEYAVCAISGTLPSEWCPSQRTEIFAADQPPLPKEEDLWQEVEIDTWTALKASRECSDFTDERFVLNVSDPFAREWLLEDAAGQAWAEQHGFDDEIAFAPERECRADDPRPILEITSPRDGERISEGELEIRGVADATNWFEYWRLEYGRGDDPDDWETLEESTRAVPGNADLYEWDLEEAVAKDGLSGVITLRLSVHSTRDTHAEKRIRLIIDVPTPTPTPTATATETPTATITATPTSTPTNTQEPPTVTQAPPSDTIPPPTAVVTEPVDIVSTPDSQATVSVPGGPEEDDDGGFDFFNWLGDLFGRSTPTPAPPTETVPPAETPTPEILPTDTAPPPATETIPPAAEPSAPEPTAGEVLPSEAPPVELPPVELPEIELPSIPTLPPAPEEVGGLLGWLGRLLDISTPTPEGPVIEAPIGSGDPLSTPLPYPFPGTETATPSVTPAPAGSSPAPSPGGFLDWLRSLFSR